MQKKQVSGFVITTMIRIVEVGGEIPYHVLLFSDTLILWVFELDLCWATKAGWTLWSFF